MKQMNKQKCMNQRFQLFVLICQAQCQVPDGIMLSKELNNLQITLRIIIRIYKMFSLLSFYLMMNQKLFIMIILRIIYQKEFGNQNMEEQTLDYHWNMLLNKYLSISKIRIKQKYIFSLMDSLIILKQFQTRQQLIYRITNRVGNKSQEVKVSWNVC